MLSRLCGRATRLREAATTRVMPRVAERVTALAEACVPPIARLLTAWRLARGKPRSVWGVTPIVNIHFNSRCDRLLGIRADCLVFRTYYIWRDFSVNLEQASDWVIARHPRYYRLWLRWVLLWALLRYDFFHYFLDRGILLPPPGQRYGINVHELELLCRAGKRLYTYTYGADVRTRKVTEALGAFHLCQGCPEPGSQCICDDEAAARNVAQVAPYAAAMLAMGDMLLYVPGSRNEFFWPLDLDAIPYVGVESAPSTPLRIGHATNHPHFKGTDYLVATVERLRAEGYSIELQRLQGVPREAVLDLFARVDVIADQFIAGFHGYTALEGLAYGKPVLVYLRFDYTQPQAEECPFVEADPTKLYTVLKSLCEQRESLPALGWRGRMYVERHYSLEAFARRLSRVYLDTALPPSRLRRTLERRALELEAAIDTRMTAFKAIHPQPTAPADGRAEPRRASETSI